MIVCAGIIATLPLYRLIRSRLTVVILVVCAGLLLVGLLLLQDIGAAQALRVVGRSPDLTGRMDLWNAALRSISKRPWLGYGFDAFWRGMAGESGALQHTVGWTTPVLQGHNGFVDLTLHLGVLGLATFAVGYLVVWRRALRFLWRVPGPLPVWLCTVLVFMLLYNLTESSLLMAHGIWWVLYTSTAVSLSPASFRQLCAGPNR
jgi:O-antigen ligase